MLFGLACEGPTDQITLENILCGYFDNPNLGDEISSRQPHLDETDQKSNQGGGWTNLLKYLQATRFRDDVLNYQYTIIQIDTDVSHETGFDVPQVDEKSRPLSTEVLVSRVISRLIDVINTGKTGFYQSHSERIIFCISVHSIEC